MPRKSRPLVYDDPFPRRTLPDTNRDAFDSEDTRVDTVPAAQRFAEESSPSHRYDVLAARELPFYPGVSHGSLRRDEATVPDAPLGRGSPVAMQAAGQRPTTEHTVAPPSGTRNRGSAPELPPLPEPPPAARARELERMIRLVTPLPTNEWKVAPSVHEWREEWGARREVGEVDPERRRRRLRTWLLVVVTLLAAAVIGTGLGDARKLTRPVDRAAEFVRGVMPGQTPLPLSPPPRSAAPPSSLSAPVEPVARATSEAPRTADAPAIPTVQLAELPLLAAEPGTVEEPAKRGVKPRPAKPGKTKKRK